MYSQMGRLEKRIKMDWELHLFMLQNRSKVRNAKVENISSRGARVVVNQPFEPQEALWVSSVDDTLHSQAHVIYCQNLGNKCYALGLHFEPKR